MEETRSSSMVAMVIVAALIVATTQCASASDQNITHILHNYPEFSTFNRRLSQTGVASEINARNTITILAPPNSVLDPIVATLKPSDQDLADILRYHVLLSYFSTLQLQQISNGTTLVTTLYQTTGRAVGQYGTVNITDEKGGDVWIGVPVPGGKLQAQVMKSVHDILFNVSVLQISAVLLPAGVMTPLPPPAPLPPPPLPPSLAPSLLSPVSSTPSTAPESQSSSPPGGSHPNGAIPTATQLPGLTPPAMAVVFISAALLQWL